MPELNSNYKVVHIMQVTDVKVKIMHSEGNLKAYAAVTFDDEFVVKDIKVIKDEKSHDMYDVYNSLKLSVAKEVIDKIDTSDSTTVLLVPFKK
jgi:stage V sporulation protein G